jgi:hypothetical protein
LQNNPDRSRRCSSPIRTPETSKAPCRRTEAAHDLRPADPRSLSR